MRRQLTTIIAHHSFLHRWPPSLETRHCCQLCTGTDCSVPKTQGEALRGIVFRLFGLPSLQR
jgi:hypothetical protein